MPADVLALGGDLGGTSTRILVVDADGQERGRGVTGGGNPTTDPAGAASALGEALAAALAEVDASRVATAVLGIAGGAALRTPEVGDSFRRLWASAGLGCDPTYVPDLEVAFASGTPEPDGAVLVAGTGAAAGSLTDRRLVRTADGHGWLLGDDGSGFWLGREAVRATLRVLDAGTEPGLLAASVLHELAADELPSGRDARDRVIRVVNSRPGVQLSALAPLVTAAHRAGDRQARSIVERAAAALVATLELIRAPAETTPIVLAGSLAGDRSPVGAEIRQLLSARFAGRVLPARNGVGGAAWLALAALDPALATPGMHARLCA